MWSVFPREVCSCGTVNAVRSRRELVRRGVPFQWIGAGQMHILRGQEPNSSQTLFGNNTIVLVGQGSESSNHLRFSRGVSVVVRCRLLLISDVGISVSRAGRTHLRCRGREPHSIDFSPTHSL